MGGLDKTGLSPLTTYGMSALSACVAETITFPADMVKTRLQLQSNSGPKRGILGTFVGIVREEGASKLYSGLTPACLRHIVYSGTRVMVYEYLREEVLGRDADGNFSLWKGILAGMSSGVIGQFVASPTDLVKVQMQADGKRLAQGKPRLYRNTTDCFVRTFKQSGIAGMWRGWIPSCQRAGLVQLGDLTTYDYVKQQVLYHTGWVDGPAVHACASGGAGLVAAILGTPADVIKTRMMSQPADSTGRGATYSGAIDCLKKTVRTEGAAALYKGFLPSWMRMAPWSLAFFLTFEQLRKATGLGGF